MSPSLLSPLKDSTVRESAKILENKSQNPSGFDRREPLYLGDWERSLAWRDSYFAHDDLDDPHLKRKLTILARHPQITWLYTHCKTSSPVGIMAMLVQVVLAYGFGRVWRVETAMEWLVFFAVAFTIGGSMIHLVGIVMHECTHGLVAASLTANKIVGHLINIAIPVPIAMSFRRYHLEHHTFQGVEGRDPDLPHTFELRLVRGGTAGKIIWMFFYPAMYALRGALFGLAPSRLEIVNFLWTLTTNLLILYGCGWRGLLYLLASLWLGYSFHPVAAHFIQEHYTFASGQETYSYYGWANLFFLNIGYHNEHHDFPMVPWNLLPLVTVTAPEFYRTLDAHYSWTGVLWTFLTCPDYGPQSRCVRSLDDYRTARKMIVKRS